MQKHVNKHKRRHIAAPISGLFIALALIGALTVVFLCIRLTVNFLDNGSERRRFEDLIRPVVMFDPGPFESPGDLDMLWLLRCGMWATLTSDKRSSYEYGDNAELIVPASDLDVAAARLFGPEVQLAHQSFGDYDMRYYYDEADSVYNVPVNALYVYSPRVVDITKDGELLNLLVAYIPPEDAWTTDYSGNNTEPKPHKYMTYVMRKAGDFYQLAKVKDPPPEYTQTLEGQLINPAS